MQLGHLAAGGRFISSGLFWFGDVAVEAAGILGFCPRRHPDRGVGDLRHLFDL